MEQYYSPQRVSRPSTLTPPQAYLSLSQPNKTFSTDSPCLQRSSSIDPECFSPLPFPSSQLNSPLKFQSSPHSYPQESPNTKKGLNLGKRLKIKVFNMFHDKNESPSYSPAFEQVSVQASISTSAASTQYAESARLKLDKSNLSQSSSGSRVGTLFMERSNSNTIDEFIAQNANFGPITFEESKSNAQNTSADSQTSNSNGGTDALSGLEQSTNTEETRVEEADTEEDDAHTNFADSLEFMLDKTPVITIFMSLISLSLISGIAVSFLEGKNSHRFIFVVLYVFIVYLLIEKTLKMFKSYAPEHPTLLQLIRGEPFYNTLDTIGYLVIAIVVDLWLSSIVSSLQLGLYFYIGVFATYCCCVRLQTSEKVCGVIKRILFILQLVAVMYKLDNELSTPWKVVLCSGWIVLGAYIVKLFEGAIQIFTAISGQNMLRVISKTSKVITIIALILLFVDLVVLMMILVGVCKVLDGEDEKMEFLKSWLTISQYLNGFLLFFSTIAGADLFEFVLTAAEHFNQTTGQESTKLREFTTITKETLLLRISQTYYKILEDEQSKVIANSSQESKEEDDNSSKRDGSSDEGSCGKDGFEDNVCYICCGKDANGVILDCGHGGICFECLTDYINKKSGCMECRRKICSVLKIEKEVEQGKIFKGETVCQLVRAEEEF